MFRLKTISSRVAATPPTLAPPPTAARPRVAGKFLFVGEEKFYVRGVTYGTFAPAADGHQYGEPAEVERDFAAMRAAGVNAVRTYTTPPLWLLDLAAANGLRVMVGLPWEQHITFLDDRERVRDIVRRVREAVRECAGHPAILCYAIGNEIPAPIVRWHGRRKVERFLRRLYEAAKSEDPEGLVTYVNYPSTEYLQLPFIDFFCFNVYLEQRETLRAYLSRLQTIAGDRPLLMTEIGLDSRRHGLERQAEVLDWQVRSVFAAGCAGAFVFAWTDQWWRGGFAIEDWDFGLVTREREPKPALSAVSRAYAEVPFPKETEWPSISVVVCSYNGARTIRDCLEGLMKVEYPNFEVVVVNDGSTDETTQIVSEYPVRLISTENCGLSAARNTGMMEARGSIVAYIDDDARPDPHWLQYLAHSYMTTPHAGIGGPNIAPPDDGFIADCVANSPGGPVHVLLTDEVAEHIPGCNMSFRREWLLRVGGCDARYRLAGDDVDLCWRVQEAGGTLGFSPSAMVWHHRRNSVRAYWRQQKEYGKAEALLEAKWPEKYNATGHLTWAGRLYGRGLTHSPVTSRHETVYHGTWGSGLFQSIYQPAPGFFAALPLMPEWFLVVAALAALSLLGLAWKPLLWFASPLLVLAVGVLIAQASASASKAHFTSAPRTGLKRLKLWSLTAFLHLMQPLARLKGRLRFGLTLWRKRGASGFSIPRPRTSMLWSEDWQTADARLLALEDGLRRRGACVVRGGDFDRWDLEVRGGLLGSARVLMTVEEHGGGKQLARFRTWPKFATKGLVLIGALAFVSMWAVSDGAWVAAACLGALAFFLTARACLDCGAAMSTLLRLEARGQAEEETRRAAGGFSPEETLPDALAVELRVVEEAAAARLGEGRRARAAAAPPASSINSALLRNHLAAQARLGLRALRQQQMPEGD